MSRRLCPRLALLLVMGPFATCDLLCLPPPMLPTSVDLSAPEHLQAATGLGSQKKEFALFPDVKDIYTVAISLSYYGGTWLPGISYSLRIAGDGTVEYNGSGEYVTGPHRSHISPEEVQSLVQAFRDADFFSLEDQSQMLISDASDIVISLTIAGQTRTVVNHRSASPAFTRLAETIKRVSHVDKWLGGNSETIPGLLADEENLNESDSRGKTVLMWACQKTDAHAVQDFLRAGADLGAKDIKGRTALMYAAVRGMPEILAVLLQAGADPKESDDDGNTPLIYAAGNLNKVSLDYYSPSPWEEDAIYGLFSPGRQIARAVQMLLQAKVNPNVGNSEGVTALMYAAENYDDERKILRVLVKAGANLNQQDKKGRTALMHAVDKYRADSVRFLIAAKADVNLRDSNGQTALGRLHASQSFRQDDQAYKQIRKLLKQAGAVL